MLDIDEREYLLNLVRADARKKTKSLDRVRRHDGQTPGEFQEFVDQLRSKLAFQQHVIGVLEDDELWDEPDEDEDDV